MNDANQILFLKLSRFSYDGNYVWLPFAIDGTIVRKFMGLII